MIATVTLAAGSATEGSAAPPRRDRFQIGRMPGTRGMGCPSDDAVRPDRLRARVDRLARTRSKLLSTFAKGTAASAGSLEVPKAGGREFVLDLAGMGLQDEHLRDLAGVKLENGPEGPRERRHPSYSTRAPWSRSLEGTLPLLRSKISFAIRLADNPNITASGAAIIAEALREDATRDRIGPLFLLYLSRCPGLGSQGLVTLLEPLKTITLAPHALSEGQVKAHRPSMTRRQLELRTCVDVSRCWERPAARERFTELVRSVEEWSRVGHAFQSAGRVSTLRAEGCGLGQALGLVLGSIRELVFVGEPGAHWRWDSALASYAHDSVAARALPYGALPRRADPQSVSERRKRLVLSVELDHVLSGKQQERCIPSSIDSCSCKPSCTEQPAVCMLLCFARSVTSWRSCADYATIFSWPSSACRSLTSWTWPGARGLRRGAKRISEGSSGFWKLTG